MSWRTFLGVEGAAGAGEARIPVNEQVTGGMGQLFGGVGMGAAVALVEERLDRPAVWASAQFISNAFPPEVLELAVELPAVGRNFGQARVVGRVGEREVLTVSVAAGSKSFAHERSWRSMPTVPGPDQCDRLPPLREEAGGLHTRIEQRLVVHDSGASASPRGETSVWMKLPDRLGPSSVGLAVIGDFLPLGFRNALGGELFGTSLDNTLRFLRRAETDWVLAHIAIDEVTSGVGHGTVQLWTEDGQLLAIASQTCTMKEMPPVG